MPGWLRILVPSWQERALHTHKEVGRVDLDKVAAQTPPTSCVYLLFCALCLGPGGQRPPASKHLQTVLALQHWSPTPGLAGPTHITGKGEQKPRSSRWPQTTELTVSPAGLDWQLGRPTFQPLPCLHPISCSVRPRQLQWAEAEVHGGHCRPWGHCGVGQLNEFFWEALSGHFPAQVLLKGWWEKVGRKLLIEKERQTTPASPEAPSEPSLFHCPC